MENKFSSDIGEEIISRLKDLNSILEKIIENKNNEEKFQSQSINGN